MRRLPIRIRLTLAFATAMALLLAATSIFLYVRLGSTLDEGVDDGLDARTAELAPLLERNDLRLAGDDEDRFVQVLDRSGRALIATPGVGLGVVLSPAALERARKEQIRLELETVRGIDGSARVLATPVGSRILVVGASLADRDEALAGLLRELALVEPVALCSPPCSGTGSRPRRCGRSSRCARRPR